MSARMQCGWLVLAALVVCMPLAACGTTESQPPLIPRSVFADEGTQDFDPDLDVELAVRGTGSAGSTIWYTMDGTPVLDDAGAVQGMEYMGPLNLTETAVLKFLAEWADGTFSDEVWEGYTLTPNAIYVQWSASGHGDILAEAWRHWDEDGAVDDDDAGGCAKCHSADGFLDFCEDGVVDDPAPLPFGLDCDACHSGAGFTTYDDLGMYPELEPVLFPSEAELSLYGDSNMCLVCHQGRESGEDVQDTIDNDPAPYTFINIHYYPAAASLFGSEANGGYHYGDNWYRPRNTFPSHPDGYSTCVGCHMTNAEDGEKHTWVPDLGDCQGCHGGATFQTLGGSPGESYTAIQTLLQELLAEIEDYANGVIGKPIFYDPVAYPYFFYVGGPAAFPNRYADFDATLLKAAYNYQVGQKEPCGYIHNGTYIQQILYDSIMDLGGNPSVEVLGRGDLTIDGADIGMASKTQQWQLSGHADADSEVFRHWDEDDPPVVEADCARCHSTPGFVEYAEDDPASEWPPTTTVDCWSCHQNFDLYTNAETRYADLGSNPNLQPVEFPSGDTASFGNASNICMACHQGRSSTVQVDNATPNAIVQAPTDYDSYDYRFVNIHYYAAAATLFGTDVRGGYEYGGQTYAGQNMFPGAHGSLNDCLECHMNSDTVDEAAKHTFLPKVADCGPCHNGATFPELSGSPSENFDDIIALKAELLAAIQDYGLNGLPQASGVFYEGSAYPYWFIEGQIPIFPNQYRDFDFDMLTAAYNYTVSDKDPGGYIHNGDYVKQLLYDSILLMGGTPSITPPDRP